MLMLVLSLLMQAVIFMLTVFNGGGMIYEIGFYVCMLLFYIVWIIKEALDKYDKIKNL